MIVSIVSLTWLSLLWVLGRWLWSLLVKPPLVAKRHWLWEIVVEGGHAKSNVLEAERVEMQIPTIELSSMATSKYGRCQTRKAPPRSSSKIDSLLFCLPLLLCSSLQFISSSILAPNNLSVRKIPSIDMTSPDDLAEHLARLPANLRQSERNQDELDHQLPLHDDSQHSLAGRPLPPLLRLPPEVLEQTLSRIVTNFPKQSEFEIWIRSNWQALRNQMVHLLRLQCVCKAFREII
jgi:hypothetical protein